MSCFRHQFEIALVACLYVSLGVAQQPSPSVASPLTNERVIQLNHSGVSQNELERVILSAPEVDFHLMPEAVNIMLQAGVSEDTIKTMAARENGVGQAGRFTPLASPIASIPSPTVEHGHTARKWIIVGVVAVVVGGAAYAGYRLSNPHHCATAVYGQPNPTCN